MKEEITTALKNLIEEGTVFLRSSTILNAANKAQKGLSGQDVKDFASVDLHKHCTEMGMEQYRGFNKRKTARGYTLPVSLILRLFDKHMTATDSRPDTPDGQAGQDNTANALKTFEWEEEDGEE